MGKILKIIGGIMFCIGLFGIMGVFGAIDCGAAIGNEFVPIAVSLGLLASGATIVSYDPIY